MSDDDTAPAPVGRPSIFSPELAKSICERLSGGEGLRSICLDEAMPGKSTVFRWLAENVEFRDQYAKAREIQAEWLADEIIEIADNSDADFIEKMVGDHAITVVDHEHIARSKLRVDARKWFAGKVAPKKYGDRITQEHTGPEGGPVIVATDQQRARALALFIAKTKAAKPAT